jgi:hypothetical protein
MPKVLAQGKTIRRKDARRLVLERGRAFSVLGASFRQVFTSLLDGYKSNSVRLGLCRANYGANLRTTWAQNSIDLYNGSAKVFNCCSVGSYTTCAVKVEIGVSAAIWWDKTWQMLHSPFSYNRPAFSLSS